MTGSAAADGREPIAEPSILNVEHARHDPALDPWSLDSVMHVSRYRWVIENFVREEMRVVDLGCGVGHGAIVLAENGCDVTAVDLDASFLQGTPHPHVQFVSADVTSPELLDRLGPSSFDLVTSMETIEHLVDYFAFLRNCRDLVAADGTVIISTPNRLMTYLRYPDGRLMDPSHVQEFTPLALERILEDYFESVEIVRQSVNGYWDRRGMPNVDQPGTIRRWYRELMPPVLREFIRRVRSRRTVATTYSLDDVEFTKHKTHEEALVLIAICRLPRPSRSDLATSE